MKKLLAIVILLTIVFSSKAQEKCKMVNKKEDNHPGNTKNLKRQNMMMSMNLSEDQKAKFKAIREEEKNKMEALSLQQTITVKEYNDKKSAIRNEMRTKREAVLTKEQKDKIASMKFERENKKNEMYDKKMAKMKESLALTEDQTKQMNALRQKTKAEVENIKNNSKLNDQEKKTQIKALVKNAKDFRMNILTKDQLIKMIESRNKQEIKSKRAIQ